MAGRTGKVGLTYLVANDGEELSVLEICLVGHGGAWMATWLAGAMSSVSYEGRVEVGVDDLTVGCISTMMMAAQPRLDWTGLDTVMASEPRQAGGGR